ncbi:hypothetical protein C2E23DRAFT_614654 [Lenzites betulinus]|nr:hypothetical protein C2E23DRAFT_614654 [Lenzites betulinus]
MSLFDLPVEIVECIIQSLNGDRRSLANCSATCHAMLTLCRPSLWSTIVLSYEADSDPRIQDALVSFGILDINPQIASYVLSLTLKMTPNKRIIWSLRGDVIVKLVRGVCGRTPNLRFLKLQGLYVTNFLNLVALAADIPTLETLVLERILMEGAWVYDEQKQHMAPDWLELPASEALAAITIRQGWNLKSLQIGGRSDLYLPPATSYASLARFLAQSADSVSLESLSVRSRYAQAFFLPLLREPSALVAPFGAVLRHLSTSIRDMTVFGDVDPAGREYPPLPPSAVHRPSHRTDVVLLAFDPDRQRHHRAVRSAAVLPPAALPLPLLLRRGHPSRGNPHGLGAPARLPLLPRRPRQNPRI